MDAICSRNANLAEERSDAARFNGVIHGLPEPQWRAAGFEGWAVAQADMVEQMKQLGPPPIHPNLVRRFIAGVAFRGRMFHREAVTLHSHDDEQNTLVRLRHYASKVVSDHFGQKFGLRVCISNGQNALAARDEVAYDDAVQTICLVRDRNEQRDRKRGELDERRVYELSHLETLRIAGLGIADDLEYRLRRTVLAIKHQMDDGGLVSPDEMIRARLQFRALGIKSCRRWGPAVIRPGLGKGPPPPRASAFG